MSDRHERRDWCQIPYCRDEADLVYHEVGICRRHWTQYAEEPPENLKRILGVKSTSKAPVNNPPSV